MEIIRCENNHYYDPDLYSSCPYCAAEAQAGGTSEYGATEPIGRTEPVDSTGLDNRTIPPTAPVDGSTGLGNQTLPPTGRGFAGGGFGASGSTGSSGRTLPPSGPGFTKGDFVSGGTNGPRVQTPGVTEVVSPGGVHGFNPVVGWLVCVDGPDRGTDYRIRGGNNYLGRDMSMDICILNDMHVSGRNAAVIGYDDVERQFFFGPAGGHNAVRVNGKMVINAVTLSPYDELTVGTTRLMFVPLCGERFDWNGR